MYHTIADLLTLAEARGAQLWQIVLENECRLSGLSEAAVFDKLAERYAVMHRSATRALDQALPTVGGLIGGMASRHHRYAQAGEGLCGGELNLLMARALSASEVNAAMGKVCAAPTAGSCGILPAVLITVGERYALAEPDILRALLTATGIGAIITLNATVSGAEGGCQAECGAAAAMAAAAAVQMAGGTGDMAANAAAFALIHVMGLVCDPVAGLVELPCAQRNASGAVNALLSADLALAGMPCAIPPDEVIDAMRKVGRMLPVQLKETAKGGLATTRSGKAIRNRIFSDEP